MKKASIANLIYFFVTAVLWATVILFTPVLVTALEASFRNGFPNFQPTWNATMAHINLRYILIAMLAGIVINLVSKLISVIRGLGHRKS